MNRHDRRKAKSLAKEVPASPKVRVMNFLEAFRKAPNEADIDIRIGASETGDAAVMVSLQGADHCLLASEARIVAQIMEETMNEFPTHPDSATLPNIIMGLRAGCDAAEHAAHPQS